MENPFKKIAMLKRIIENNRIWRFDYFFWNLVYFLIIFISMIPIAIIVEITKNGEIWMAFIYIFFLPFYFYWIYLQIIASIKRLHDINLSWWHYLWFFLPIINIIFWLILIFKSWNEWTNRFWPSPKYLLYLEKKLKNNEISKEEYDEKIKNLQKTEEKKLDL